MNSEKEVLQRSVDTLQDEHRTETEQLKEDLKQRLDTAAEQYEAKLQAEISKGALSVEVMCRHVPLCSLECSFSNFTPVRT